MIYENERDAYIWEDARGVVLNVICEKDENTFKILKEEVLELIGYIEEVLEGTFPGADFMVFFFVENNEFYSRKVLNVIFGNSTRTFGYFKRLWGVKISSTGTINEKDSIKVREMCDKKSLDMICDDWRDATIHLGMIDLNSVPKVQNIVYMMDRKLRPYGLSANIQANTHLEIMQG